MIDRIFREKPGSFRIRTHNAFSNASMLAINNELGFAVTAKQTAWQADVDDVLRRVASASTELAGRREVARFLPREALLDVVVVREAEQALGDDVAQHLAGAAADRERGAEQEAAHPRLPVVFHVVAGEHSVARP